MAWPGRGGVLAWRRARAWMLVFSSALITQSSGCNGWPSQEPAYRSKTRPAFSANCGSRGKSQLRCCHGLSAFWSRMRKMVLRLIGGASGCAAISRARSAVLYRLSGSSWRAGSSQASALIVATCRGGKSGLAPAPRLIRQLPPRGRPAPPPGVGPVGVLPQLARRCPAVEARLLMQQQGESGTGDLRVRRVMLPDEPLAGLHLLGREGRLIRGGRAGHGAPPSRSSQQSARYARLLYQSTAYPHRLL